MNAPRPDPTPSLLPLPAYLDPVCARFEAACQAAGEGGSLPQPEDYLGQTPAPDRLVLLQELVALEMVYRQRRGETLVATAYRDRFPDLDPAWLDHELQAARTPTCSSSAVADSLRQPIVGPLTFLRTILTPSDHPGDLGRFGDYRVLDILGGGGMGIVLRAEETPLGRPVALKLMRPELADQPIARKRFLREAQAAAAVVHPRVVVIHRVGEVNATPFLAMQLLAGQSLAQRLKTGPAVSVSEAVHIAREIAEGLGAAHAHGLIHRDIKPGNIWLELTPEGTHVRLLDFGLVRRDEDQGLTDAGVVVGTASYMAPEQAAASAVDARADLFSLGCVLYELATGKKAFAGPDIMAVMFALANHHPPTPRAVNPAIPLALSDLIVRLLAKDPAARVQSATEVVAALQAIEKGPTNAVPPIQLVDTTDYRPEASPRRRRGLMVAAVLGLLGVLGMVVWLATRSPDQSHGEPGRDLVQEAPVNNVPLRVVSIAIDHCARLNDQDCEALGILGKRPPEAKAPRLGDQVTVKAQLSRPSYAYLLAFRPDGVVELCSPQEADQPPTRDDQVRYPTKTESAALRYGLQEGTGMWVFAVVASDEALPAYREWKARRPLTWSAEPDGHGKVWWYDGEWLEQLSGPGAVRGERAKGEKALGPGKAVVRAAEQLHASNVVTAALGFGVGPRD